MVGSVNDVIDDLGGTGEVSAALELPPSTVSTWRTRGIPPSRWVQIAALAASRGHREITLDALAALPAPESAEARA